MNGQRGISGQRLALSVVSLLTITVLLFSFCLSTYHRLSAIRVDRDRCWRPLAQLLDDRYRALELLVARGVDQEKIDMRWGEKWRSALDYFRAVSGASEQEIAAQEVEDLLMQLPVAVADSELKEDLYSAISFAAGPQETFSPVCNSYRQIVDRERELLKSVGGKLIDTFLKLPAPHELRIAGIDNRMKV